jgi:hypothetical protein
VVWTGGVVEGLGCRVSLEQLFGGLTLVHGPGDLMSDSVCCGSDLDRGGSDHDHGPGESDLGTLGLTWVCSKIDGPGELCSDFGLTLV